MGMTNQENNRRENEANSHRNNDDPTGNEEESNTHDTRGREETIQASTARSPPIYFGLFSGFIMLIALPENFQLLTTLKPYDGTGDPHFI